MSTFLVECSSGVVMKGLSNVQIGDCLKMNKHWLLRVTSVRWTDSPKKLRKKKLVIEGVYIKVS